MIIEPEPVVIEQTQDEIDHDHQKLAEEINFYEKYNVQVSSLINMYIKQLEDQIASIRKQKDIDQKHKDLRIKLIKIDIDKMKIKMGN